MKVKTYNLIRECIERGTSYGWNRAHKHVNDPTEDQIKNAIEDAIMNEICEWFTFEDESRYE